LQTRSLERNPVCRFDPGLLDEEGKCRFLLLLGHKGFGFSPLGRAVIHVRRRDAGRQQQLFNNLTTDTLAINI
jgi:hypothetical protein